MLQCFSVAVAVRSEGSSGLGVACARPSDTDAYTRLTKALRREICLSPLGLRPQATGHIALPSVAMQPDPFRLRVARADLGAGARPAWTSGARGAVMLTPLLQPPTAGSRLRPGQVGRL